MAYFWENRPLIGNDGRNNACITNMIEYPAAAMKSRDDYRTTVSLAKVVWKWAEKLMKAKGFNDNFSAYVADLIRHDKERGESKSGLPLPTNEAAGMARDVQDVEHARLVNSPKTEPLAAGGTSRKAAGPAPAVPTAAPTKGPASPKAPARASGPGSGGKLGKPSSHSQS